MDNIDTLVKGSERASERTDPAEVKANGQTQGASFNAQATSSYLVLLSKQRGLLSEGLSRTLNSLAGTLNEYIKNPASAASQNVDLSSSELAQYRRLSEQVISRDASLQEKVAQNLSTSHRLVRSRDAAAELSKSMQNLPESLREGTQAGKALSRFICESLVDLTDPKTMGAGLERDLAVRSVFVPKTPLNTRSYQATSNVLSSSIAYIESNQLEVLRTLRPESSSVQERAAENNTTPQAMTRYLRQALNEFPDDSTYLDIFKQNRDHKKEEPYQDKLSKETAERIHSLISRAADTARRGNLVNRTSAQVSQPKEPAESPTARAVNHNPTEQIARRAKEQSNTSADGRELSLSELSARAAKLQQQFREERQKLVEEGKLPNPAEYPKDKGQAPAKSSTESKAAPVKTAAVAAEIKETTTSAAPKAQAQPVKTPGPQADTEAINKLAPRISYQGIQSSAFNFGSLSSVPGQTLAYNAMSVAGSAQVQDLSAQQAQAQVMAQQQELKAEAPTVPESTETKAAETAVRNEPVLTSEEINALKELARHAQELQKMELRAQQAASQSTPAQEEVNAQTVKASVEAPVQETESSAPEQTESTQFTEPDESAAVVIAESVEESSPVAEQVPQEQADPQVVIAPEPQPTRTSDASSSGAQTQAAEKTVQVVTPEERAYAESAAQAARRQENVADLTRGSETAVAEEEPLPAAPAAPVEAEETAPVAEELAEESAVRPESTAPAAEESAELSVSTAAAEEALTVPPMPAQSTVETAQAAPQNTVTPMPSLFQSSDTAAAPEQAVNELAKLYKGVTTQQSTEAAAATQASGGQQVQTPEQIMLSTVPADELDDSEVPQDAKQQGADGKAGHLATATLDTTAEHTDSLNTRPLSAPGAAAVTTGGSAPVPEQSVVEEQSTIKENTLFSRIVSLFGNREKTENLNAQAAEATMAAAGSGNSVSTLKGSPLDSMLYALRSQAENPNVPPQLRAEAQRFMQQLENPVADLTAVNNWLNFVTGPISPSSPQALALHQWAFMLLCIRFNHIGKSIDKYLARVKGEPLKASFTKLADSMSNQGGAVVDMLEETLDEVSRLQTLAENREAGEVFPRYIPLPPNYSGGREGGMSVRREQEEDGSKSWHLTFNFDLPGLGPIEIKAVAKLPELRLSVVAETLSGLQRVQECLPILARELQKTGITTRAANARLGRIVMQNDPPPEHLQASGRSEGLSVEI